METNFKIKKVGKYIDIQYVTGFKIPIIMSDNIWVTSAKEGRKVIKLIRDFEVEIKKALVKNCIDLDFRMIILKYLKTIDSISTGFDIRSNMSIEELSIGFVFKYKENYEEILKEVKETYDFFNEVKANSSYMKNWRRYDQFNSHIYNYSLDYPRINSDDFGEDELKNMSRLANEMLETLINKRKEQKNN